MEDDELQALETWAVDAGILTNTDEGPRLNNLLIWSIKTSQKPTSEKQMQDVSKSSLQ